MKFLAVLALFYSSTITFANGRYMPSSILLGSGKLQNSCKQGKEEFRAAMIFSCYDGGCDFYYGLKLADRVKHYEFFADSYGQRTIPDRNGISYHISVRANKNVTSIEGEPIPPYDDGWVDGIPAGIYLKNVEIKQQKPDGEKLSFVFTQQRFKEEWASGSDGIYIVSVKHQNSDGCVEKWHSALQRQKVTKEWLEREMSSQGDYSLLWKWKL